MRIYSVQNYNSNPKVNFGAGKPPTAEEIYAGVKYVVDTAAEIRMAEAARTAPKIGRELAMDIEIVNTEEASYQGTKALEAEVRRVGGALFDRGMSHIAKARELSNGARTDFQKAITNLDAAKQALKM